MGATDRRHPAVRFTPRSTFPNRLTLTLVAVLCDSPQLFTAADVAHQVHAGGEGSIVVGSAAGNAVLRALCALDGAAIANAIETFDVRLRNEGFVDNSIRSLFPDLPPAAGYAVTARIRCSTPPPVGYQYTDRTDWWQYIVGVPAPRFVVVEDVDDRPGLGGFVGELHATVLRALDCVGYATNGSVRDADAVRARVGLPMFASGVAVSHAFAHIVEFGGPVKIGGLRVASGDLLFGDAHGVQSIPPELIERIPAVVAGMMAHERQIIALCRSPQFSIDALTRLVRSSR